MNTVPDLFESTVAKSGDAQAVIYGDEVVGYLELNARANRLARRLIAAGVGPDTLVAIAVPRSIDQVVVVLAVLKAGGAYLPLDPSYPADRLAHMVSDARPALLVHAGDVTSLQVGIPQIVVDSPAVRAACARERGDDVTDDERLMPLTPDNLMYVIYTSGSTGVPKGVAVSHWGVPDLVRTQATRFGIGRGERVLQWASISFDAWFWDFALALLQGGTLVMADAHDLLPGESLRDTMLKYDVAHAVLPPVALSVTDSEGLLVGGTITSTGDTCTSSLAEEWSRGRRLYNAYGPTETTVGSTIGGPIDGVQDDVTVGQPWAGARVYILDDRLRNPGDAEEGEFYLGGTGMARGYLNRPGMTATRFVADPFGEPGSRMYRSGDRGRYEAAGDEFFFAGRIDDQVKVRGFRIELGEIEATLATHPDVDIAVAVVDGDVATARIVAYVKASGGSGVTGADLREHTRRTLPEHMVPSTMVLLERFPTLSNGKIDRKALLDLAPPSAADGPPVPAAAAWEDVTSYEKVLCGMVMEILTVADVTPQDNFFDLGGHSVLAAKLASRIRKELGVSVPMRSVFEATSLAELARILEKSSK